MASTEIAETDLERVKRLAAAYSRLESVLCDLSNMALLVWDSVSDAIGNDESAQTGSRELHYVPEQHAEKTIFAVGHLIEMLCDAKGEFFATIERTQTGSAAK